MGKYALILAAGRGSRMNALTENKPKCLLELNKKPLLSWQLEALNAAGLNNITVVTGYKQALLTGDFNKIHNDNWQSTNMVQSLLCALPSFIDKTVIIAYSDIVYSSKHVQALMTNKADIAITYDTKWKELWTLRNDNPLSDAETFKEQDGKLLEIGAKPQSLNDVQGQYMGLLQFSAKGIQYILELTKNMKKEELDKLDMTSLLSKLLANNVTIHAVPINGGWCECDTENDIKLYEQQLLKGDWTHDWRINLPAKQGI